MKFTTVFGLGLLIVGVWKLWSWIEEPAATLKPLPVTISHPRPGDAELVEQAMQVFMTECPDLFGRFRRDVDLIEAQVYDTMVAPYLEEQRGWRRNVYLQIKLSENARYVPGEFRPWNQTLHYWLGAGWAPGIRSQKDVSQQVCGFPPGDGADVLTDVPALAFIDQTS
jgi:hypothetical protein